MAVDFGTRSFAAHVLPRLRRRCRSNARAPESAAELGEDRQVGMKPDPFDPSHAEREQRPLVLQAPELALDGATAPVEGLPPLRLARDQRMQPVRLDPPARRLALAGRAAPLGRATRGVTAAWTDPARQRGAGKTGGGGEVPPPPTYRRSGLLLPWRAVGPDLGSEPAPRRTVRVTSDRATVPT